MKKGLVFLLLLMVLLVGCEKKEKAEISNANQDDEKIQIGMIFDTFVIERWQSDRDVFVSNAKELGAEVDVQNANGDVKKQVEQMNYFIDKKVDVIVIVPIESDKLIDSVERARKEGIKVISYDRLITNANTDLYISFDNEEVGKMMGQAIASQVPYQGNVLRICGPMSDNNVSLVNLGFQEALEKSDITMTEIFYTEEWKAEYAAEYVEGLKYDLDQIQAIMCGNDNIAGQVIHVLSEQRMAGEICVVGQDADLDACQRIVEGTQFMTVYKPVEKLAAEAAKAAVMLANGESVDTTDTIMDGSYQIPYIKIQPISVTLENINEVIIDSGFHLKEDVYLNRPDLLIEE